jgi:hypothetical protein
MGRGPCERCAIFDFDFQEIRDLPGDEPADDHATFSVRNRRTRFDGFDLGYSTRLKLWQIELNDRSFLQAQKLNPTIWAEYLGLNATAVPPLLEHRDLAPGRLLRFAVFRIAW